MPPLHSNPGATQHPLVVFDRDTSGQFPNIHERRESAYHTAEPGVLIFKASNSGDFFRNVFHGYVLPQNQEHVLIPGRSTSYQNNLPDFPFSTT